MARGGREHGRLECPVLALRRPADPDPDHPRDDDPALRERVRGAGDRLPAHRRDSSHRHIVAERPVARRRAEQRRSRLRHGDGDGRDHGSLDHPVPVAPAARSPVAAVRLTRAWWWIVFLVGFLYFFVPLLGTFIFSLGNPLGAGSPPPSLEFYGNVLAASDSGFWSHLAYSFVIGIITIIVSIGLLLPTAFWVRLRLPKARPFVEFITLLPFVIPPIVLVFGLISTFSHPPLPFTYTDIGSSALLTFAYVVLSFPYMYRAIDTGLQAIDIRSLTEAAQSLGASWPRIIVQVILPNVRVALLSGAFLTLAIVVGEFTIATFLARPAFGPYLSLLGQTRAYEPAAASIISFGLTWMAMILIAFIGRGSRARVVIA